MSETRTEADALPDRRFRYKQLVTVHLDNGTQPLGRVTGWEDGRRLGRFEPRRPGWVYDVELEGHDGQARRTVRAKEEALEALTL